ncbi:hypothetical protein F4810DRAFT_272655 [Camillea tinctor]|nr:hypothetical protein F4810DRAFT_272655 [Camillea tinctor]
MASKRPEGVLITLLESAYHNVKSGGGIQASRQASRQATRQATRPATKLKLPSMRRQLSTAPTPTSSITLRRLVGARILGARTSGCGITRVALAQGRQQSYATKTTKTTSSKFKVANGIPPPKEVKEVAILGGGITGLTTAYYLARHAKDTHITIYEASDRLGGWINTEPAQFNEDVLVHRGPRMLRASSLQHKYDDLVFYDVAVGLNLQDQILPPKPAAKERYIFYPDHLVQLPSPGMLLSSRSFFKVIQSFIYDKVWDGCFRGMWKVFRRSLSRRPLVPPGDVRAKVEHDESLAEFLYRSLGDERPVHNIVSAMIHGIYGGDVRKLSAKHTIFDSLWYESTVSIPSGFKWMAYKDMWLLNDICRGHHGAEVSELAETMSNVGTFMFEDGLLSLLNGLVRHLEEQKNVTIKYNAPVTALRHSDNKVTTSQTKNKPDSYDQVICTLFSKHLAQIAQPQNSLRSLAETHAVTIMVVNLWYPNSTLLDSNHGFGYLVPTTTPDNDECVLGVLFDSDFQARDEPSGTKLTVMLGGHYWDDWEHLPTEEMGVQMAIQAVKKHLGISEKEQVHASARLCRDCLPQHFVGHRERMKRAHYELHAAFKGKLMVAGPSYTSVGVIPAMRAGFDAAMRVATGHGPPWIAKVYDAVVADDKDKVAMRTTTPNLGNYPQAYKVKEVDPTSWHESGRSHVGDHVGETGLEGFTMPLISTMTMLPTPATSLRAWSKRQ